jgi:phage shock protein PspC (stress-responsive transcriptional regulator)
MESLKDRKLYRSQENRMIGGVCGGIGEYFEIDPNLIRLILAAITLIGGIGLLLYIASLVIIPNNPDQTATDKTENLIKDKSLFWGSLLIIFGLFLLLRQFGLFYAFDFWHLPWQSIWALLLIGIGAVLLYRKMKEDTEEKGEVVSKKLYRSKSDRMIGGGGLAAYFELDVSIVRVLWVLGTIVSAGIGVLAYIVMLFVFPEAPDGVEKDSINA